MTDTQDWPSFEDCKNCEHKICYYCHLLPPEEEYQEEEDERQVEFVSDEYQESLLNDAR